MLILLHFADILYKQVPSMTFDKVQNFQMTPLLYSNGTPMLNASNAPMVTTYHIDEIIRKEKKQRFRH
jgi:hypothetical protein